MVVLEIRFLKFFLDYLSHSRTSDFSYVYPIWCQYLVFSWIEKLLLYIFSSLFFKMVNNPSISLHKNICLLPSWTWTPMLCYEIYYLQKILAFFVRWLLVVSVVSPVYIVSSHSVIAILLSPFLLPYIVFMQCIIILQKSREEWCTKQFEFVILTYLLGF